MSNDNRSVARLAGVVGAGALLALVLITAASSMADAEKAEAGLSFDGLKRVENSKVAMAYIDPDADFSTYKRVKILEPNVAFRSNWRRDQNRRRTGRVSVRDM